MRNSGFIKKAILIVIVTMILCVINNPVAFTETWQALPPYNFLWPLWSSALSPVDFTTGLRTPIVSDLTSSTILPLQPGIAWNPAFTNPYLIYNSPIGLQYYDVTYGINPWPPQYSRDPVTGAAIPLNLPVGYQYLPVTNSQWVIDTVPWGNLSYLAQYPSYALAASNVSLPANLSGLTQWVASLAYPNPSFSSLLSPGQILGYTGVVPSQYYTPPAGVVPPLVILPGGGAYPQSLLFPINITTTTTTFNPGAAFLALVILGLF